jgi:hypothetical protein
MTEQIVAQLNWENIANELDKEGYVLLPKFLSEAQVSYLVGLANSAAPNRNDGFRPVSTGQGETLRLTGPLPQPLQLLRDGFYRFLAPIAQRWSERMGQGDSQESLGDVSLPNEGKAKGQDSFVTFSRLREGEYQGLHQSKETERHFPIQLVAALSAPGEDFTGGEFVMTEQRPRMQSRPIVLQMQRGDAALIAVAHKPFKGSKGFYRVNLKHAVSRVRSGQRLGMELLFHGTDEVA